MTKSISEYARLEAERMEILDGMCNSNWSKGTKKAKLNELRRIEREMGIESNSYNSSQFSLDLRK